MASITAYLSDKSLRANLADLGFDDKKAARFIKAPYCIQAVSELLSSFTPRSATKSRKGKYENLCLYKDARNKNWVIYDPCKHLIAEVQDMDILWLLVKHAVYQHGNPKFLEFNIRTRSLRFRSATKLKGKHIVYTQNGPTLQSAEHGGGSESPVTAKKDSSNELGSSDSELTEIESEGEKALEDA